MTAPTSGLSEATVEKICSIFTRHPTVEKAVLYGSRAKGNYKNGSDIDLALFGNGLEYREMLEIADQLDELFLPYTIDLSIFDKLDHAALREHIQRVGVVFYQRAARGTGNAEVPGNIKRSPSTAEGALP